METGRHCAYNVTRNALVSERVACVEESSDEAVLLELVMNGPGLDRHAAVWVGRTPGWIDLPRLFAFDFAYLDEGQRIVESGGVGPGAGFPAVGEGVAGALILAARRLAETGAAAGDQVRICAQAEVAALVKAASPKSTQGGEWADHSAASQSAHASPTAFEVSRYSEYVFEPFAGSLVFLPQAEAPLPQSTEYFLPDKRKAAEESSVSTESAGGEQEEQVEFPVTDARDKSEEVAGRRRRQKKKKAAAPTAAFEVAPPAGTQDEPHFYRPKPIQFFDPAAAGAQESPPGAEMEEMPARQSTQLPPDLKAAILQIDEQLRREKEELENRGKDGRPKERKRKAGKKAPVKKTEEKAAHPAWEELGRPSELTIKLEPEEVETRAETVEDSEVEIDRPVEAQIEAPSAARPELPEAEPEIASALPLAAADRVEETTWPTESVAPQENAAPPARIAPPAPPRREVIELAPVTEVSVPRPPLEEPAPAKPRKVVEPEPAPVKKTKQRKEGPSLGERLQRWVSGEASLKGERRKGERVAVPGLVAFYWSGGAPRPHEIVNISKSGFYLRTKELWLPDTLVRMTLQRSPGPGGVDEGEGIGQKSIGVLARVVRIDEDGVGHEFVTTETLRQARARDVLPDRGTDPKELEKFLKGRE